jgi:uncharacterized damage-inducible protein DinB
MSRHLLTPHAGLTTGIGYYFSGMQEVREQLCEAVKGIPDEQLGRPAFAGAHSIGALALHIGEAEWWWMQCVVSGHKLTEQDRKACYWDVLKDPDGFAGKGYTADFCLQEIEGIRNQTRDLLSALNDNHLESIRTFERRGENHEHSLRWILHHLADHEAQHKGQILMLKRLMAL